MKKIKNTKTTLNARNAYNISSNMSFEVDAKGTDEHTYKRTDG